MNILAMAMVFIANTGIHSRHSFIRKLVSNDAYVKLMIIVGALKWYDMPYLHHPLIRFRMDMEWRMDNQ
jgi:hypothetical protein